MTNSQTVDRNMSVAKQMRTSAFLQRQFSLARKSDERFKDVILRDCFSDTFEMTATESSLEEWQNVFRDNKKFNMLQEMIAEFVELDVDSIYSGTSELYFPDVYIAWSDLAIENASMTGIIYILDNEGAVKNSYGTVKFTRGEIILLRSVANLKIKPK